MIDKHDDARFSVEGGALSRMESSDMSRFLPILILIGLAFACPAKAQSVSPEAQLRTAQEIFLSPIGRNEIDAHAILTKDLTGRWLMSANSLISDKMSADEIKNACDKVGAEITVSTYTINVSQSSKRKDGSLHTYKTVYADRGLGAYGYMADPEELLSYLGVEKLLARSPKSRVNNILRDANGIAQLYRPSPDILVIIPLASPAKLAMRCS
jgi:hypothetical protein